MRAKQIVKNSKQKYATCTSYRDSGLLTQESIQYQEATKQTYEFQTSFVSKNKFLIEVRKLWQSKWQESIFWSDGDSMFLYYKSSDGDTYVRKQSNLEKLARNPELSLDSCPLFILPLLMPDFIHPTSEIFKNTFQLKSTPGDRYHLMSNCRPIVFLDVFINRSNFSISEILLDNQQSTKFERKVLKVEYKFIEFDSKIPDEIFNFKPSS